MNNNRTFCRSKRSVNKQDAVFIHIFKNSNRSYLLHNQEHFKFDPSRCKILVRGDTLNIYKNWIRQRRWK